MRGSKELEWPDRLHHPVLLPWSLPYATELTDQGRMRRVTCAAAKPMGLLGFFGVCHWDSLVDR